MMNCSVRKACPVPIQTAQSHVTQQEIQSVISTIKPEVAGKVNRAMRFFGHARHFLLRDCSEVVQNLDTSISLSCGLTSKLLNPHTVKPARVRARRISKRNDLARSGHCDQVCPEMICQRVLVFE